MSQRHWKKDSDFLDQRLKDQKALPWPCGQYGWISVLFHVIEYLWLSFHVPLCCLEDVGRWDTLVCIVSISFCVSLKEGMRERETEREPL